MFTKIEAPGLQNALYMQKRSSLASLTKLIINTAAREIIVCQTSLISIGFLFGLEFKEANEAIGFIERQISDMAHEFIRRDHCL